MAIKNNNNTARFTMSVIDRDKKSCVATCKVLIEMGIENPSMIDCLNVRYISECVSKRSAYLVSTGLAVLLNKMDEKLATIGVDGSVYRYHPYYKKVLFRKTRQLTNSDIMVRTACACYGVKGGK